MENIFDNLAENLTKEQLNGKQSLGDGVDFSWECFAHSDTIGFYVGKYRVADVDLSEIPYPEEAEGDTIEIMLQSNDSPLLDYPTEMVLNVNLGEYKESPIEAIAKKYAESVAYDWLNLGRAIMGQV